MGLYNKNQQILKLLLISLVCSFFDIALAQVDVFAKAFSSLDFPLETITCLANIFVFSVTLIRARLDLENGAREVLGILRGPKLEEINGSNGKGLSTCKLNGDLEDVPGVMLKDVSVVMLSNGTPNSSMTQLLKSNAVDDVHSILLQYVPFNKDKLCQCQVCNCIPFWRREDISSVLARRMPRTLKLVNDSLCLLPCRRCLVKGCHGCHGLPWLLEEDHAEEAQGSSDQGVVSDILDDIRTGERICMCIPLHDADRDKWTEKLVRSLGSKDAEGRGVRVKASEALESYLDGNGHTGSEQRDVHYNLGSFILPRLSEIIINLVLTFWFTVDGFSSSLAARRTVRNYLVDSKGSGLAANAFLTDATVKFDGNKNHVFQVLTFRGNGLSFQTLSFTTGVVNMICFIGWAVLIPFEGGNSGRPLSIAGVVVIIAAIAIALIMDCLYLIANRFFFDNILDYKVSLVMISEIVCIVTSSVLTGILGINVLGKWVYSALQLLVWVKWGVGSYILDQYSQESSGYKNDEWLVLVFSSAFLLNAALAGVRSKWSPSWPWKDNYLFGKH